jgi:hypothetical protein
METYCKLCPACQTPATLQAATCHHCGHTYRTQFVAVAPSHEAEEKRAPTDDLTAAFGPNLVAIFAIIGLAVVIFTIKSGLLWLEQAIGFPIHQTLFGSPSE